MDTTDMVEFELEVGIDEEGEITSGTPNWVGIHVVNVDVLVTVTKMEDPAMVWVSIDDVYIL